MRNYCHLRHVGRCSDAQPTVHLSGRQGHVIAANGLPLLGCCTVFFALNITFIGYYQSIENAVRSTAYTLLRGIILLVPCFLVLPSVLGISGLWLAIPAAEALTLAVIIMQYLRKHIHLHV